MSYKRPAKDKRFRALFPTRKEMEGVDVRKKYAFKPYGADGAIIIGLPVQKYKNGEGNTVVVLRELARRLGNGKVVKGHPGLWHRPAKTLRKVR